MGHPGRDRGRDAQRLMDTHEIVVHEVQRDRRLAVCEHMLCVSADDPVQSVFGLKESPEGRRARRAAVTSSAQDPERRSTPHAGLHPARNQTNPRTQAAARAWLRATGVPATGCRLGAGLGRAMVWRTGAARSEQVRLPLFE
jgi:hypothetical protein